MPGYHTPAVPIQQQHPYYSHQYPAPAHSPGHNPYAPYYHPAQYGYQQPDNQGRMGHRGQYPQDNHRYPMYAGVYQPMAYPMPHRAYPQPEMSPYAGRMEQPQQPQLAHPPQQPMVVSSNQYAAAQQFTPIARSSPAPHTPRSGPPPFPDRSTHTPVSTTPSVRDSESTEGQRRPSQAPLSPMTPTTTASMVSTTQDGPSSESSQPSATLTPVSPQPGKRMPFYPPVCVCFVLVMTQLTMT